MAPKKHQRATGGGRGRKVQDAARGKELQQRGLELTRQADFVLVTSIMKDRHDYVQYMVERMVNDGVLVRSGNELNISPSYTPPALSGAKQETDESAHIVQEDEPEEGAEMEAIVLHRNFTSWGLVPPKYLRYVLSCCERISLSKWAFKAVTAKGAKEPPKELLLEIVDRMCDIPNTQPIGLGTSVGQLVQYARKRNMCNGRRCQNLVLKPRPKDQKDLPNWQAVNWQEDGFWSAITQADSTNVLVELKGTDEPFEVTIERKQGSRIRVDMNFSRSNALLVYICPDGTEETEKIADLYAAAGFSAKRARWSSPSKTEISSPEKTEGSSLGVVYNGDEQLRQTGADNAHDTAVDAEEDPYDVVCMTDDVALQEALMASMHNIKTEEPASDHEMSTPTKMDPTTGDADAFDDEAYSPPDD